MITLFPQHRKYYNQNNTILHLVSHMALAQACPFINATEPSSSVAESFDEYAQTLTAGNFEIISNLEKILVRVHYALYL